MDLFWRHGYEATSLRDLVGAMGLSRSSFYQAFGSKHQLFLSCLVRYQERTAADLRQRLDAAASGRVFIRATLLWAIEEVTAGVDPRGCLIMNTATEFAQRDAEVADRVARGLELYREVFVAAARRAQSEGDLDEAMDAELVAAYLVTSMSGLRTMAKAGADLESLRATVEMVAAAV